MGLDHDASAGKKRVVTELLPSRAADVVVRGHLTAATRGSLRRRLRQVVGEGARQVRVDLSHVESLDAAAATVLVVYRRLLPPLGGELILVAPSSAVDEALTRLRLGHLLGRRPRRTRRIDWADVA